MGFKRINRRNGFEPVKAIMRNSKRAKRAIQNMLRFKETNKNLVISEREVVDQLRHSNARMKKSAKNSQELKLHYNYKNLARVVSAIESFKIKELSKNEQIFLSSLKEKLKKSKKEFHKGNAKIKIEEVNKALRLLKKISPEEADNVLKNIGN